jgi:probable phosphoglycerate mutase
VKLLIIRHGATAWSRSGQHTSRTDLPLLDEGRDEARRLAPLVRSVLGDDWPGRVISSPMGRARETAQIIFGEVPLEVDDDLREMDYGVYEGLTRAQIREAHPGWDVFNEGCAGGETLADVAVRVERFIASIRDEARPVTAVAHGHVLRIMGACVVGLPAAGGRALELDTATLSVVQDVRFKLAIKHWNIAPGLAPPPVAE